MNRTAGFGCSRRTGLWGGRGTGPFGPGGSRPVSAGLLAALAASQCCCRLAAARDLQLVEDVVHVVFYRGLLDEQPACDFLVGQATLQQLADLTLACGQAAFLCARLGGVLSVAHALEHERRDARRADQLPAARAVHRLHELSDTAVARNEPGYSRCSARLHLVPVIGHA